MGANRAHYQPLKRAPQLQTQDGTFGRNFSCRSFEVFQLLAECVRKVSQAAAAAFGWVKFWRSPCDIEITGEALTAKNFAALGKFADLFKGQFDDYSTVPINDKPKGEDTAK